MHPTWYATPYSSSSSSSTSQPTAPPEPDKIQLPPLTAFTGIYAPLTTPPAYTGPLACSSSTSSSSSILYPAPISFAAQPPTHKRQRPASPPGLSVVSDSPPLDLTLPPSPPPPMPQGYEPAPPDRFLRLRNGTPVPYLEHHLYHYQGVAAPLFPLAGSHRQYSQFHRRWPSPIFAIDTGELILRQESSIGHTPLMTRFSHRFASSDNRPNISYYLPNPSRYRPQYEDDYRWRPADVLKNDTHPHQRPDCYVVPPPRMRDSRPADDAESCAVDIDVLAGTAYVVSALSFPPTQAYVIRIPRDPYVEPVHVFLPSDPYWLGWRSWGTAAGVYIMRAAKTINFSDLREYPTAYPFSPHPVRRP